MSWNCQRPNTAYNENKLFDKHFEHLFKPDYSPADIHALNQWVREIEKRWATNSLGLNEVLLAVPSYMRHHLLYGIQMVFSIASNQQDKVPAPAATLAAISDADAIITQVVTAYNSALDGAAQDAQEKGRVFSPHNWLKGKDSLNRVRDALRIFLTMLPNMQGGKELKQRMVIDPSAFGLRWSAE